MYVHTVCTNVYKNIPWEENKGSNKRFSAILNLYQVPLDLYCRSSGAVLIQFSSKMYRIKIVTTCLVLYLSDPAISTQICRAFAPRVNSPSLIDLQIHSHVYSSWLIYICIVCALYIYTHVRTRVRKYTCIWFVTHIYMYMVRDSYICVVCALYIYTQVRTHVRKYTCIWFVTHIYMYMVRDSYIYV